MKSKKILILLIIVIILGVTIFFKFFVKGVKSYTKSNITFDIPKYSFNEKENDKYSLTFNSFRSKNSLKKEINNILNNYIKKTCNYENIYYLKNQDITITNYDVTTNLLFNKVTIKYYLGKFDDQECAKVGNYQKTEYRVNEIIVKSHNYKYLNDDGNLYNVYVVDNIDIEFKNGGGAFMPIATMLKEDWMSMHDVFNYLEYLVKKEDAKRLDANDGGSKLYQTNDFNLLRCNTISGNKDVYIGKTNMDYDPSYCVS